jgi:DNA polymerase-3 subunit alpha
MYIIFDTETTGLPQNYNAPLTDFANWPRVVQIAWQLHDERGALLSHHNFIVRPDGFTIPFNSERIHGISTALAMELGRPLTEVLDIFAADVAKSSYLVGHNIEFDINILGAEFLRLGADNILAGRKFIDTKDVSTEYCAIPGGKGGKFKWPTLTELHQKLFGEGFNDAHDAAFDVDATSRCFFGLFKVGVIAPEAGLRLEDVVYEPPKLELANFSKKAKGPARGKARVKVDPVSIKAPFSHLHVHSQYSILQAMPTVADIVKAAKEFNMPAVALTDLGNMFGTFKFVNEALKAGIKPILGCEFYVAEERLKLQFTKDSPDKRFNQVLLAKNREGFLNLAKLASLAFTEGNYGIHPRIDKALIKQYRPHLIALSGGLSGEVPSLILNVGEHQAEEAFKWWLDTFQDDFYVELIRHGLEAEDRVNEVLLEFADKYGVKVVASNEVYYTRKEDSEAHDILLCVRDGEKKSTPIGRGRGFRYGFPNNQYYFKSQEEMKKLFADVPEAIENISEIVEKVEEFSLNRDVLLPVFDIPAEFVDSRDQEDGGKRGENAYLRYLTYEGAKKRYRVVTEEIKERLDFELATIERTGYPGYFLIVQDFTNKAREMGVSVGPGRGSAAGSAVAYCVGITNVDPIKYNLLFERFLNPDRVSLPDIDIDFDDEGRGKVIDYVINKYGKSQVAQIITYNTMAAKSALRDCGRVLDLPLHETNNLAKLIPDKPIGLSLKQSLELEPKLKKIRDSDTLQGEVVRKAETLEGSLRNTGVHACGVIITPDDIQNFIPVAVAKDSELVVTQYDNSIVESAGLLKMDFLGLKTLTIINDALKLIKKKHGKTIDIENVDLEDKTTFELFSKGLTMGLFQFESPGMQKHLKSLQPDKFEDLIAMNALYRPGPMEYIPEYINRKHGKSPIVYDLPAMEPYLKETYGITVYQEQVMLLSQALAGFTKGQADKLRKAMGKKQKAVLDEMKESFLEGCKQNGHDLKICNKIWTDWEAFASYAFNKSHSTCYAYIAFQTGYLKAHYPAEYMASVLTHNLSDIKKLTKYMKAARDMDINVLGPNVNESGVHFEVNDKGEIRFGLGAIKGAGESAVESIIEEREKGGPFKDIFDFACRVNLRVLNKRNLEALAESGAFDCFPEVHRRQYLEAPEGDQPLIEKAVKYAQKVKEEKESAQISLFGGGGGMEVMKPRVAAIEPYPELIKLKKEREVVGLYISGHPLDQFKLEIQTFCNSNLNALGNLPELEGKVVKVAGIITEAKHLVSKNNKPFGFFTLEDYNGEYEFRLFDQDYLKYKTLLEKGWYLHVTLRVERSRYKEGEFQERIQRIELLANVWDTFAKGLKVDLDVNQLDSSMLKDLEQLKRDHPGNRALRIRLTSPEMPPVEVLARNMLIGLDSKSVKRLRSIFKSRPEVIFNEQNG